MNPDGAAAARTIALPDGEVAARLAPGADPDGEGLVLLAHATGLNKDAYAPFVAALRSAAPVLSFDMRGHGRTTLPADPRGLRSWRTYAEDTAAVAEAVRAEAGEGGPTLIGHSMGALAVLLAAASGTACRRLILIEPVVLPKAARLVAHSPLRAPLILRRGIAASAGRRTARFPSREAARTRYAQTPFFKTWQGGALEGYLAAGLTEDKERGGVRLACDPAWEAATFAAQAHSFWRPLARVRRAGVPVTVIRANRGSTLPPWATQRLVDRGVTLRRVTGPHVLCQANPEGTAGAVREALS